MKRFFSFIISFILVLSLGGCNAPIEDTLISDDAQLIIENNDTIIEPSDNSPEEVDTKKEPDEPLVEDIEKNPSSQQDIEDNKSESSNEIVHNAQTAETPNNNIEVKTNEEKEEAIEDKPTTEPPNTSGVSYVSKSGEVRAIWLSYLEWQGMLKGKTKEQFTTNISNALNNITSMGLNTVYVHARSHSDAYYDSDIFPWSENCSGTEGVSPGFDPLSIIIREAHSRGLKVEAWVNPYRIRGNTDTSKIANDNPAKAWLNTGKVKIVDSEGIYYNPAYDDVIELVVDGVKEIVNNYDVDGIHFDDYFYPTKDASFDKEEYSSYQKDGGKLSLDDWRRDNVNRLVSRVYSAIKSIDSSCRFGISPTGNMDNNYSILYCDVYAWVRSDKYVDYICPQIYFGFSHDYSPYTTVLDQYNSMISSNTVDLITGLAAYKIGQKESSYAGDGINEWINNSDILAGQVIASREKSHYKGFALYRYDSLFNPSSTVKDSVKKELANLEEIL